MAKTLNLSEERGVLHVRLNRPEVKNALNPAMIAELRRVFRDAARRKDLRAVELRGEGGVFCSGGDLAWMRESLSYTRARNLRDVRDLYDLFAAIDACPLPVVAGVEGYALGGGLGLVSVCDYVVAEAGAKFSLSEVKVGLVPGCIGPFVLRKVGPSHCRALFLTAMRFDAAKAQAIGLVHELAEGGAALDAALARVLDTILSASPQAVRVAKRFLARLPWASPAKQAALAVKTLADIRVSPEGQEGVKAFLEKRPPRWESGSLEKRRKT